MKAFASLLLVCYVAGQSAALDLSATDNHKTEEFLSKIAVEAKKAENLMTDLLKKFADTQNICKKDGTQIMCCAKDLLKNNLCLGISTQLSDFSMVASFAVNNRTFINETISGKTPPPVCAPPPHVPLLKLCVEPYDLGYVNGTLNVCMDLSAKMLSKDLARVKLNCIQINKNGDMSFVTPSKGTGKAVVSVDTSNVNPMINKTLNPIDMSKQYLSKLWG